jgi:DNA polymerase V
MNGKQDDFNPHNDNALPSGFPSPGQNYIDAPIDFNELVIENEAAIMIIAILNGQFTVKRYCVTKDNIRLVAENPKYPDITIAESSDFEAWGVLTHSIR